MAPVGTEASHGRTLAGRLVVYAATAGVLVLATTELDQSQRPPWWLLIGLLATDVAVLVWPVSMNHRTGDRNSLNSAVFICMGFLMPWGWAVVLYWIGAVLAGFEIRRHRTTAGGMVFGSSSVTLSAAAGIALQDALATAPVHPLEALATGTAAWAVSHLVWAVVVYVAVSVRRPGSGGRPPMVALLGKLGRGELEGIAIGSIAGWAALQDERSLVLSALMVAIVVATGVGRTNFDNQTRRLGAVLELANRLARVDSTDEANRVVLDTASDVLRAPVAIGETISKGEIGSRFPSPDDPDTLLVARRRHGPPAYLGAYNAGEREVLDAIAVLGSAAVENQRLLAMIHHHASHDPLTDLLNRAAMRSGIEQRMVESRRHSRPFSVLYLDLDHFKQVNDRFGHDAGDHVLRSVADRLRDTLRADDLIGRWGGEEFVVVGETSPHGADDVGDLAARAAEALTFTTRFGEDDIAVTASVGGASWSDPEESIDALLHRADRALMEAKQTGRNRVVLSDSDR